ncbi:penicillin acylase family protein [Bremerella cremea]|uniref:penicillin acylase family protein n=1 Tax=Bremerella cremea TaxID=1031537 RepID=UPI0031EAA3D7
MEFPRLTRDITIQRDDAGVPHINAKSRDDALYGLGYMHATDRLTQILFARAVASGQAAQAIAPRDELLETDRFFRRVGLHRNQPHEMEYWPEDIQHEVHHYCTGVNDGMKAIGHTLPMWATGFEATPWDPVSVLYIGNLLSFGGLAVSQLENERIVIELIQAGGDEDALRELFPGRLEHVDFDLVRQVHNVRRMSDEALEVLMDLPRLAGSNAWVVGPAKSKSGAPILCSDPHLETNRLPAIWYEAVLRWDDNFAMGATLPGCPLFAVGRTKKISWGVTYMKGDTTDFFIEDVRKSEEGNWQYRRDEDWFDYHVREEAIGCKGKPATMMRVFENPQGVLEVDPEQFGDGYYFSLAWTGTQARSGMAIASWLQMLRAESTAEGLDVAKHCPQPTLCWVVSDVYGNIGLQGNGRFPRRRHDVSGLGPVAAWDARNHWQGSIGIDQLPRIYNPECGFIATANEDINQPDHPKLVSQTLPDYRKRRIVERLNEMEQITVTDMQQLQYDLLSIQAREILPILLPFAPDELKEKLKGWDFRYDPASTEAVAFQRFYRNTLLEIFGHERGMGPRRTLYLVTRAGFSSMIIAACDAILKKDLSLWWQSRDKGEMIHTAGKKVLLEKETTWGQFNSFHFTDRFFGGGHVGRLLGFDSPQYAMPGCHATVFQGHVLQTATRESTFAPSYHLVTDMAKEEAWTNLPGGPSESRFSWYYKSDVPRWLEGGYKRIAPQKEAPTESSPPKELPEKPLP